MTVGNGEQSKVLGDRKTTTLKKKQVPGGKGLLGHKVTREHARRLGSNSWEKKGGQPAPRGQSVLRQILGKNKG